MHIVSCGSPDNTDSSLLRRAFAVAASLVLAIGMALPPSLLTVQPAEAKQGSTLIVAIDPGHGGTDPGASGNGVTESVANWRIAAALVNELNTYSGVKAVLTRGENEYLPGLEDRVQRGVSQGADVVVSIHCNSVDASSASGAETFVPCDSSYLYNETRVVGYALGSCIQSKLVELGFKDRGVKVRTSSDARYPDGSVADYYGIIRYARQAGIPGLIVEHGFVTNASDAAKLGDATWCAKIGVADATAIAEYYGLSKIPTNGSAVSSADVGKVGEAVKTERTWQDDVAIMGAQQLSDSTDADTAKTEAVEKMAAWYSSKNKTYPADAYERYGAATIVDFCAILYEEALDEGIRPEVVFAQAMKETGWLQFGGQVKVGQCNFCGLGALDGATSGSADFSGYGEDGVRMGLRAQVQHLRAYADSSVTASSLKHALIDPRFDLVTPKGKAPTVQGLSGTWASDSGYGDGLVKLVNDLLGTSSSVTNVAISLADVSGIAANSTVAVYVNGEESVLTVGADGALGTVPLSGTGPQSVVVYSYSSADQATRYPTSMSTWLVSLDSDGNYVAKRYYGLENLMIYSGCAIRTTGQQGIRILTGMSSSVKSALAGGGIDGYTLVETGTLLGWTSKVGDSVTMESEGASRGKAYVAGSRNPVYGTANGIEYYTNVLTGNFTAEQCSSSLAMRPYVILKDAAGNQFVIYGGTVHRSVKGIAQQYLDAGLYVQGTSAYSYVYGLANK